MQPFYSLCLLLALLGGEWHYTSDTPQEPGSTLTAFLHVKIWILPISILYRKQLWAIHPTQGLLALPFTCLAHSCSHKCAPKRIQCYGGVSKESRAPILSALNEFCAMFPLLLTWFYFSRISGNVHKVCPIVLRLFFFPLVSLLNKNEKSFLVMIFPFLQHMKKYNFLELKADSRYHAAGW